MTNPFQQNVIAVIWDFDKTLINGYMQNPIFKKYGVDGNEFWKEVNNLEKEYQKVHPNIRINKDTIYLNHFLTCVKQGIFKGLNNNMLNEMGRELEFYPGMPEFFIKSKQLIEEDDRFKKHNITVEHYIVSTGIAEMIRGSVISEYTTGIWGCEFIEEPISSNIQFKEFRKEQTNDTVEREISQIGYAIDNTSKTRAIFEINKGSNINNEIDVNSTIERSIRRVPFQQMIYIADGPSDVPAFSIVRQNEGSTFAVYPEGKLQEFKQVDQLRKDNRIDMYGEANYVENTTTYMWLMNKITDIANDIFNRKEEAIRRSFSKAPGHISE
ncbi:hypothetical protein [Paenibacillus humicus]|uniref:hypothetical protein n=1 Tax=Paenibacillus humicus TaxID=412861 RepID=UPI003D2E432A